MNHVIIPATGAVPVLFVGMSEKPIDLFLHKGFAGYTDEDIILVHQLPNGPDTIFIDEPGDWELLGLLSELTDKQVRMVVHCKSGPNGACYNYNNQKDDAFWGFTPTESLSSLMQSVGAYTCENDKSFDGKNAYDILRENDTCPIRLPKARTMTEARIDYDSRKTQIIEWYNKVNGKAPFPYWSVLVKNN